MADPRFGKEVVRMSPITVHGQSRLSGELVISAPKKAKQYSVTSASVTAVLYSDGNLETSQCYRFATV